MKTEKGCCGFCFKRKHKNCKSLCIVCCEVNQWCKCHSQQYADLNGHAIDAHGELIYDPKCHACDAPKPQEEEEWEKRFDKVLEHVGSPEQYYTNVKSFIREVEQAAYQRGQENMKKRAIEIIEKEEVDEDSPDTITEQALSIMGEYDSKSLYWGNNLAIERIVAKIILLTNEQL